MKKQFGYSYASILIALVVIQMISLTFVSSIFVTNQATDKSNKTIIATRLAESCLEKNTHFLKTGLPLESCELEDKNPYKDVYKISFQVNDAYLTSSYSSPIISTADSNLKELVVTVEYLLSDGNGEDTKTLTLSRLVVTNP